MEEICCICLQELDDFAINLKCNCNNKFHEKCIIEWFKNDTTCPMCRNFIDINYPFIISENIIFRNKVIVVINSGTITFFKNNILINIILYQNIKSIKLGNFSSVHLKRGDDTIKKLYFNNNEESNFFYKRLKLKMQN